jgi:hypothetical protein
LPASKTSMSAALSVSHLAATDFLVCGYCTSTSSTRGFRRRQISLH